jgi:hypothetical protein
MLLTAIDEHAFGQSREFAGQRAHVESVEPGRFQAGRGRVAVERLAHGFIVPDGHDRGKFPGGIVPVHHDLVEQAVDQRPRDRRGDRCYQMHPCR